MAADAKSSLITLVSTLVIEVNFRNGGGAILSSGWLHTNLVSTWDEYETRCGKIDDLTLAKTYVETANGEYFPWLEDLGVVMTYGGFGGETFYKTRVVKLYANDNGAVVGVQAAVWEEKMSTTLNGVRFLVPFVGDYRHYLKSICINFDGKRFVDEVVNQGGSNLATAARSLRDGSLFTSPKPGRAERIAHHKHSPWIPLLY